ncbi:MAG: hypothetical protein GX050_02205 [Firmicutes bacterium]|nr:hypothetical protein [Bacillota bacterium]
MKEFIWIVILVVIFTILFSGCRQAQEVFSYQGIVFEGFDPLKHQPSEEFRRFIRPEKVVLSSREIKSLRRCVDLLKQKNLMHLLEYADRFVIVNSAYSFADKPQMVVYLDKEKVTLDFSISDDWKNKLLNSNLSLMEKSNQFAFKGTPELPNLLRIILHEVGHLVEYDQLKFNWKGKFIENELNKDFVNISWDQSNNWKDREGFSGKVQGIHSVEGLVTFFHWFKHESSFLSLSSSMGMNEDFAEAFVYYFLNGYYNYKISFVLDGTVLIDDLQTSNLLRDKKLAFIAGVVEK